MEFVYVVPRGKLFPDCYPQGLTPFGNELEREPFLERISEHGYFVERAFAERTPSLKQLIPYTIVARRVAHSGQVPQSAADKAPGTPDSAASNTGNNGLDGTEILLLRRLKKSGDARLHDKLSIGVGGHLNPEDGLGLDNDDRGPGAREAGSKAARTILSAGSQRELDEEIAMEGNHSLGELGLINDDSNSVGAVHLGLVQVLWTDGQVRIREEDVLEGSFISADRLCSMVREGANFETWSSLLIDRLEEILAPAVSLPPGSLPGSMAGSRAEADSTAIRSPASAGGLLKPTSQSLTSTSSTANDSKSLRIQNDHHKQQA